jgi:hypothetical protein
MSEQNNAGHRGCWCPELKDKTAIITGSGGMRLEGRSRWSWRGRA